MAISATSGGFGLDGLHFCFCCCCSLLLAGWGKFSGKDPDTLGFGTNVSFCGGLGIVLFFVTCCGYGRSLSTTVYD